MDQPEALRGVVDRSGFPLQLAVAHAIDADRSDDRWKVQYTEHAWRNDVDGIDGFIDLVIENQSRRCALVVECKRVQDASWVFLNPSLEAKLRRYAKAWVSRYEAGNITECDWADWPLDPASVQSEYCAVFGQDPKNVPMLERVGATLISSTEALALEERVTLMSEFSSLRVYLNVIVTTAKLKVASFDPASVSLKDGTVANCTFSDVPFIRFRKQLSTRFPKSLTFQAGDTADIAKGKQNTVFVVNAERLPDFIHSLSWSERYR